MHSAKLKPYNSFRPVIFLICKLSPLAINPASVFSCYHQYVKPFLLGCFGRKDFDEEQDFAISESFAKKKNKDQTQFLKAFYTKGKVLILNAQESYKMDSVAQANCLVEFPEGATEINIGEKVKIWKV
jgi:molybdopterin molybdotransferase